MEMNTTTKPDVSAGAVDKLTPRMLEVLRHAEAGRPLDSGLSGRSAYGGLSRTVTGLHFRGLLQDDEITEAGRAALAAQAVRHG